MKIILSITSRDKNLTQLEAFEIGYEQKGHICSVIVYGDINKPQVYLIDPKSLPALPVSRYWFFMNISWSKLEGFEFNQYTDQEITTSLNSTVDKLRGNNKIQINNGLINLIFKAEVNQADLGKNKPKNFLEKCSEFGVKVANIEFLDCRDLSELNCPKCLFANVKFINSDLEGANFSGGILNNVEFKNLTNLERANFTNCQFSQVEFSDVTLRESVFDNCRVVYNKSRIEKDEVLIFHNSCDLSGSSFAKAILCSKFEDSNLSSANFSEAKLVACKFYDCTVNETIFSKSRFTSFGIQSDKSQKPNTTVTELITCCIGAKTKFAKKGESVKQGTISNCKFDSASMTFVDISHNLVIDTDFEDADLSKAKLNNCEFVGTTFNGKTLKSAKLLSTDASYSIFKQGCKLNEVNLSRVRMIETRIEECELVRANFYGANLRSSQFINSDFTGVDFRCADLTLVNLDKCKLNGANFFETQRGGINLNVEDSDKQDRNNNKETTNIVIKSSCIIDYIEWSSKRDGQIQIDENEFLSIVYGKKSAAAVISNLFKENPSVISYIYNETQATANAKSAGNDLNDGSVNIDGNVTESEVSGSSIETEGVAEQNDNENQTSSEFLSDELASEDEEQI
jgi:uncharacterized protein YjbI with pentapeptide repeats